MMYDAHQNYCTYHLSEQEEMKHSLSHLKLFPVFFQLNLNTHTDDRCVYLELSQCEKKVNDANTENSM